MIHPLTPIYTPRLVLRCWKASDAPLLKAALDSSLEHLRPWMPWANQEPSTITALEARLAGFAEDFRQGRDFIYGIFNRHLKLVAMAHLALMSENNAKTSAEFGVSVLAHARGRGYGARLFERAVIHARNENVSQIYIHALSENAPMIRIARKSGATLERDGSETEAYLSLPKRDLDSRVSEIIIDQYAKANYLIKSDAQKFWSFLSNVQEIRQGVRHGRHQFAE
jgi:RimJ/RimL family protein N-acetyltransferase